MGKTYHPLGFLCCKHWCAPANPLYLPSVCNEHSDSPRRPRQQTVIVSVLLHLPQVPVPPIQLPVPLSIHSHFNVFLWNAIQNCYFWFCISILYNKVDVQGGVSLNLMGRCHAVEMPSLGYHLLCFVMTGSDARHRWIWHLLDETQRKMWNTPTSCGVADMPSWWREWLSGSCRFLLASSSNALILLSLPTLWALYYFPMLAPVLRGIVAFRRPQKTWLSQLTLDLRVIISFLSGSDKRYYLDLQCLPTNAFLLKWSRLHHFRWKLQQHWQYHGWTAGDASKDIVAWWSDSVCLPAPVTAHVLLDDSLFQRFSRTNLYVESWHTWWESCLRVCGA